MVRILFSNPDKISESEGITLRVNPAKRETLEFPERQPWERMRGLYSEVLEDNGLYRMWYGARSAKGDAGKHTCYAESEDGIHWSAPEMGIVEFNGSTQNNLINAPGMEGSVFVDPNAPEGKKYCGVWNVFTQGLYVFRSSDGLCWERDPEPLLKFEFDSQNVCFFDQRIGKYVGYVRMWEDGPPSVRRRLVGRWEAETIDRPLGIAAVKTHPNPERLPHLTEELPVVMACDESDDPESDVYTNAVIPHPDDSSYYLAFPVLYTHFPESDDIPYQNAGTCETHFWGSTDGIEWHRYDRTPYAVRNEDEGMVYIGRGIVRKEKETWQYGVVYKSNHGDIEYRMKNTDGEFVRFVQRKDGYVSADAEDGYLKTEPVEISGLPVTLNADTGNEGSIELVIRDEAGNRLVESEPVTGDDTELAVRWKEDLRVEGFKGLKAEIECRIKRVKLFSINS